MNAKKKSIIRLCGELAVFGLAVAALFVVLLLAIPFCAACDLFKWLDKTQQRLVWNYWLKPRLITPQNRAFVQAILNGNDLNVGIFLKRGADRNLKLIYGIPVLRLAAEKPNSEVVRLLLEAGADPNVESGDQKITPLMSAAAFGRSDSVVHLLKYGADHRQKSHMGKTALMFAAHRGDIESVRHLVEYGADVNALNRTRGRAADFAAKYGHGEIVNYLLSRGAEPIRDHRSLPRPASPPDADPSDASAARAPGGTRA